MVAHSKLLLQSAFLFFCMLKHKNSLLLNGKERLLVAIKERYHQTVMLEAHSSKRKSYGKVNHKLFFFQLNRKHLNQYLKLIRNEITMQF